MKNLVIIAIIAVAAWYFTRKKEPAKTTKSNLLKSGVYEPGAFTDSPSTTDTITTTRTDSRTSGSRDSGEPIVYTPQTTRSSIPGRTVLSVVFSKINEPKSAFQP